MYNIELAEQQSHLGHGQVTHPTCSFSHELQVLEETLAATVTLLCCLGLDIQVFQSTCEMCFFTSFGLVAWFSTASVALCLSGTGILV